jgi:hypothetical protein
MTVVIVFVRFRAPWWKDLYTLLKTGLETDHLNVLFIVDLMVLNIDLVISYDDRG